MGFEVGGNTAVLEFGEGTALDGAFVRISLDMSVKEFLALQRRATNETDSNEVRTAAMEATYQEIGDAVLVDWDVVLKGEPLPATGDGLLRLPWAVAQQFVTVCLEVMSGALAGNSSAASANIESQVAANGQTAQKSRNRGNLRRLS